MGGENYRNYLKRENVCVLHDEYGCDIPVNYRIGSQMGKVLEYKMSAYRFLNYDGKIITNVLDFLNQYEEAYFFQNNMIIENDDIMPLYEKDNLDIKDFALIMKWKIGSVYNEEDEDFIIKSRSGEISAKEIVKVIEKFDSKQIKDSEKAKELFNCLLKIPNIGTVYAVTIIHFFSKGYYPIFDQFAQLALERIMDNDTEIWKDVKKPKGLNSWKGYEEYIHTLNLIFGEQWRNDYKRYRKIDRALWVYGHMFKKIP